MKLEIIKADVLRQYIERVPDRMQQVFNALHDAELSTPAFSFYTSLASVFSSKIEGEDIELDSYIKHKRDGIPFKPDYTKKIDNLYQAYIFARDRALNETNMAEAHKLLSKHFVATQWQGKYRAHNMYITTEDGRIEYVAALPDVGPAEMKKLYNDLEILLEKQMDIEEVFFFAAMIHLVFVKIHPWNDGNGRSARLIEKWFLANKLGAKAWFIESEKYYFSQHNTYYKNIRLLGLEYPELDYTKALPFLLMLPECMSYNLHKS